MANNKGLMHYNNTVCDKLNSTKYIINNRDRKLNTYEKMILLLNDDLWKNIHEDVRIAVFKSLVQFCESSIQERLSFPSSLTSMERAFIHVWANILNLKSRSKRSTSSCVLTVFRQNYDIHCPERMLHYVNLTWSSQRTIYQLIQTSPITARERLELHPRLDRSVGVDKAHREERQRGTTGRLMGAVPQVPSAPVSLTSTQRQIQQTPPAIMRYRTEVVRCIETSSIVIISGPSGAGKTTYLPQILMEECFKQSQRCRMICTEPRRLYAHINAERLAEMRNEPVGQTIGYQIRLESKGSRLFGCHCADYPVIIIMGIYSIDLPLPWVLPDGFFVSGPVFTGILFIDCHVLLEQDFYGWMPFLSHTHETHERVSPRTLLTFCTHGVLLRTIYADFGLLSGTTHILIDEIEEDELPALAKPATLSSHGGTVDGCGILLGLLPSLVVRHPHLKVILLVNSRYQPQPKQKVVTETTNGSPSRLLSIGGDYDEDDMQEFTEFLPHSGITNPGTSLLTVMETVPRSSSLGCCQDMTLLSQQFSSMPMPSQQATQTVDPGERIKAFSAYFCCAPVITIPHSEKTIEVYHLEEILHWLGYWTPAMAEAGHEILQDASRCQALTGWLTGTAQVTRTKPSNHLNTCLLNNERQIMSAKPLSLTESACLRVPHAYSSGSTVSTASRQHADYLLWAIWQATVLAQSARSHSPNAEVDTDAESSGTYLQYTPSLHPFLTNLHQCMLAGWFPVDYQHTNSGLTALMVCSAAGLLGPVERLLSFGADVFLRVPASYDILVDIMALARCRSSSSVQLHGPQDRYTTMEVNAEPLGHLCQQAFSSKNKPHLIVGVTAYDLAVAFGQNQVAERLKVHMVAHSLRHQGENWEAVLLRFGAWFASPVEPSPFDNVSAMPEHRVCTATNNSSSSSSISHKSSCVGSAGGNNADYNWSASRSLLTAYHVGQRSGVGCEPDTVVDLDLLMMLLVKMDSCLPEGTILIFLPSYEEIITLRERLLNPETVVWSNTKHQVLILHTRMLVPDLSRVYALPPSGVRKIILAMSIAETCMTFEDVVYIIDSGISCSKHYIESMGVTRLRNHWVSKSSAIQRQYRVGAKMRGACFRLYSSLRSEHLKPSGMEDNNLQISPIEEACIQTRLLSPPGVPIQSVLCSVPPRPPSLKSCQTAIQSLFEIDVVDSFEELTELGYHICDIPIPPRYAKMVLVGVALKCLDPILTITCILSYSEPFTTARNAVERRDMLTARKKCAADTFSDHMMLLRAFQFWQKARSEGWEKSFCQKNFISTAAFEIITVIRTQLLGQLRASGFVKARGSGDIRDLNTNSENWAVVKAAIVAGMSDQFAWVCRKSGQLHLSPGYPRGDTTGKVYLHPHSVLATNSDGTPVNFALLPSDCLVYDTLISLPMGIGSGASRKGTPVSTPEFEEEQEESPSSNGPGTTTSAQPQSSLPTGQQVFSMLHCVTVVSSITLTLMAGPVRLRTDCLKPGNTHPRGGGAGVPDLQRNRSTPHISPGSTDTKNLFWPEGDDRSRGRSTRPPVTSSDESNATNCALPLSDSDSESEEAWRQLLGGPVSASQCRLGPADWSGLITRLRSHVTSGQGHSQDHNQGHVDNSAEAASGVRKLCQSGDLNNQSRLGQMGETVCISLDNAGERLQFHTDHTTAQLVIALRQKWHSLLLRRLRYPGKQCSQQDEMILSTLVSVLTAEEQQLGLRQPSGVGARPRPMAAELCNAMEPVDQGKESNSPTAHTTDLLSISQPEPHLGRELRYQGPGPLGGGQLALGPVCRPPPTTVPLATAWSPLCRPSTEQPVSLLVRHSDSGVDNDQFLLSQTRSEDQNQRLHHHHQQQQVQQQQRQQSQHYDSQLIAGKFQPEVRSSSWGLRRTRSTPQNGVSQPSCPDDGHSQSAFNQARGGDTTLPPCYWRQEAPSQPGYSAEHQHGVGTQCYAPPGHTAGGLCGSACTPVSESNRNNFCTCYLAQQQQFSPWRNVPTGDEGQVGVIDPISCPTASQNWGL